MIGVPRLGGIDVATGGAADFVGIAALTGFLLLVLAGTALLLFPNRSGRAVFVVLLAAAFRLLMAPVLPL